MLIIWKMMCTFELFKDLRSHAFCFFLVLQKKKCQKINENRKIITVSICERMQISYEFYAFSCDSKSIFRNSIKFRFCFIEVILKKLWFKLQELLSQSYYFMRIELIIRVHSSVTICWRWAFASVSKLIIFDEDCCGTSLNLILFGAISSLPWEDETILWTVAPNLNV